MSYNFPSAAPTNIGYNPYGVPASPSSLDDEFGSGSSLAVKWISFDPGTIGLTNSIANGMATLTATKTANTDASRGYYQALPAGDFTVVTKVSLIADRDSYSAAGLMIIEDTTAPTTTDLRLLYVFYTDTGSTPGGIVVGSQTAYNVAPSQLWSILNQMRPDCFFRIRRGSTTFYYDISLDGIGWETVYSATFTTTNPGIGIYTNASNGTTSDARGIFSFFRYKASNDLTTPIGSW